MKTLSVDTTRSSLSSNVFQRYPICNLHGKVEFKDIRIQEAPFELETGEPLHLRVFLDKTIMEVYANHRQCVTQRIYPTRPDSLGVSVFCTGGSASVNSVEAWRIDSTITEKES